MSRRGKGRRAFLKFWCRACSGWYRDLAALALHARYCPERCREVARWTGRERAA